MLVFVVVVVVVAIFVVFAVISQKNPPRDSTLTYSPRGITLCDRTKVSYKIGNYSNSLFRPTTKSS